MQQFDGFTKKRSCVLGIPTTLHGIPYRYCRTCGVYHPQMDAGPIEAPAFPARSIPPPGQFARAQTKLTLVSS